MENLLYGWPNNTVQFLKVDRLSSMYLRGTTCQGCKLSVVKCPPLHVQPPPNLQTWSRSLLVSIVWFISLEQFLLKISMERAERAAPIGKLAFTTQGSDRDSIVSPIVSPLNRHYNDICVQPHREIFKMFNFFIKK